MKCGAQIASWQLNAYCINSPDKSQTKVKMKWWTKAAMICRFKVLLLWLPPCRFVSNILRGLSCWKQEAVVLLAIIKLRMWNLPFPSSGVTCSGWVGSKYQLTNKQTISSLIHNHTWVHAQALSLDLHDKGGEKKTHQKTYRTCIHA